jgi:hypothetical protein
MFRLVSALRVEGYKKDLSKVNPYSIAIDFRTQPTGEDVGRFHQEELAVRV